MRGTIEMTPAAAAEAGSTRLRLGRWGAAALLVGTAALAWPAEAQDLARLQREIQEMRRQYDAQMEQMRREHDGRVRALEERVRAAETKAGAADAKAESAQKASQAKPTQAAAAAAPAKSGESGFNPAIGVVLDGRYGHFSKNPDNYRLPGFMLGEETGPGDRGFRLGESELNLSANVDQSLYGSATIAFTPENGVEVEEAYLKTTALPYGFGVKAGRFFSGIGTHNGQHAHEWDFGDAPLAYRAILANQVRDDGVQLRWVAPLDFLVEVGAEAMRGASFPASGASNAGVGTKTAFVHVGDDIGQAASWRLGYSHMRSKARARSTNDGNDIFTGNTNVSIIDAVFKWAPNGNPKDKNLKLQGEFLLGNLAGALNGTDFKQEQRGWYAQAIYQFAPRWSAGIRHDRVKAGSVDSALAGTTVDNRGESPRRTSGMLEFRTSEFGRIRGQYNYDQSRTRPDHQLFMQYTISLGAHGAHGY